MNHPKPAPIPFTQAGYSQLTADLERYSEERKEVLIRLQTAREMGDLSENGAYHAAKFELGRIDRELRRLTHLLRYGKVTATGSGGVIDFGARVTLDDGTQKRTFLMVSGYESDPGKQKLSIHSPLGKAIIGHKVGDKVTVTAPAGPLAYTIIRIFLLIFPRFSHRTGGHWLTHSRYPTL